MANNIYGNYTVKIGKRMKQRTDTTYAIIFFISFFYYTSCRQKGCSGL